MSVGARDEAQLGIAGVERWIEAQHLRVAFAQHGLDVIRIATGYRINGKVTLEPPLSLEGYGDGQPVYEELPGWRESTVGVTEYDALPVNARKYLERLQSLVDVPIDMISTGPDRDETITLRHPFGH